MGNKYHLTIGDKEIYKTDLKKMFDEYNKLYFDSKLGKCEVRLLYTENSNYGSFHIYRSEGGKSKNIITISMNVLWTDETLKEVLVHEMVHMYVVTIQKVPHDGVFGHGRRFRSYCRKLKKGHGLSIRKNPFLPTKKQEPKSTKWLRFIVNLLDW